MHTDPAHAGRVARSTAFSALGGGRNAAERGFTLVEILIAVTMLSVAVVVVVGGMNVLVVSSSLNRSQGNVGAVVRRAAEAVRGDAYVSCTSFVNGTAPYSFSPNIPAQASQLPENAKGNLVLLPSIKKVTTFDGQTILWSPDAGKNCPAGQEQSVQMVQIAVDAADSSVHQTILVAKAPS